MNHTSPKSFLESASVSEKRALTRRSLKKCASTLLISAAALTVICPPMSTGKWASAQTTSSTLTRSSEPEGLDSQFGRAVDLYSQQQWVAAADAFQAFLSAQPLARQSASAKFFIGESYTQAKQFASAYPWYESFVSDYPEHQFTAVATFRMGEAAWRTGQEEKALRALERFVQQYPKHELLEYALTYLGQLRIDRGEAALAKDAFGMCLQLFPQNATVTQCQLGMANALQMLGDQPQAISYYESVIASSKETKQAKQWIGEAQLKLGIIAFEQKQRSQSVELLSQALKQTSGETKRQTAFWLARAENAVGDHVAAVELTSALIAAADETPLPQPMGSVLLFEGAIAAEKTGREELSCLWLEKLRTWYPTNAFFDKAFELEIRRHQQSGRGGRVIEMFENINRTSPENPNILLAGELAGRTFYAQGDHAKTVETFQTLLERTAPGLQQTITASPSQRVSWQYLKSLGYLGLEHYEAAEHELSAIDASAASPELSTLISLARATAFFGRKQFSDAIEHYQAYLEIDQPSALTDQPTDEPSQGKGKVEFVRASCELAICHAQLSQWEEARRVLLPVHQLPYQSTVGTTTQFIAEQAFENQQTALSAQLYTLMLNADYPQIINTRGLTGLTWINMDSMDYPQANSFFKRLISDYPDSKFARNAVMSRAKFLEEHDGSQHAVDMYNLVIDRFSDSHEANVARQRKVVLLQEAGGRSSLLAAKEMLIDQLQRPANSIPEDETLYRLGWVLSDLGQRDAAQARFSRLVEQFPESPYWSDSAFRIASQRVGDGQTESAIQLANQILDRTDGSPEIYSRTLLLQCQLAAQAENWPEVTRLTNALHQHSAANSQSSDSSAPLTDSMNSKANYWLAESLYQQGFYNQSSQQFAGIIEDTNLARKLQPWVRLRLAQCLVKLKRWPEAQAVAIDGAQQFPNFSHQHEFTFVRARATESQGLLEDAIGLYQTIAESESSHQTETAAISQWRIGEIHFHRENYANAIESYQRVAALNQYQQWQTAAILQAGKCQEHLGNLKHAAKLYTQLVEKFPNSQMTPQAQERLTLVDRQAQNLLERDPSEKRR